MLESLNVEKQLPRLPKREGEMATRYHKLMEDALVLFGGSSRKFKVFRGSSKPLSIVDASSKLVINYKPDVYYIKRTNNKKIIFEILETELRKQDIIIADVARCCLADSVERICFIYSSEKEEDFLRVQEALYTVVRGLSRKGIPAEELPTKLSNYPILRDEANDITSAVGIIRQLSKEDKW